MNRNAQSDGGPVALLARPLHELFAEAHRTLAEAWKERERLGSEPASTLADF